MNKGGMFARRGQLAVFVVVAIVIVASLGVYFLVKETRKEKAPMPLLEVFDYYQSCIEQEARMAIKLAETQGGYVTVKNYIPGSEYAPFSSNLNFFGFPVPYWYYISGNGLIKEQIPAKADIEKEISEYVSDGIENCDFEQFNRRGISVETDKPRTNVRIEDRLVKLDVSANILVSDEKDSARKTSHEVEINSKLGRFYDLAREIYSSEKENMFFEKYAVDVMRLYAPVDGVEIQCAPKIWATGKVTEDIKNGLEENFRTIKFEGDYYKLKNEERKYFVIDKNVDENINIMYSKDWPTKIEIAGENVNNDIITAEAIGTQAGLGAMGFCYVPYHFVYDISFPAMIQIYNSAELFQFPVLVIVDNNQPRRAILSQTPYGESGEFDLCNFQTEEVEINLYNNNLNRIDANISYGCFNQLCRLGESRDGRLLAFAPSCLNGYILARTENYAEKKELFSTNKERVADLILEREFETEIKAMLDGKEPNNVIVSFVRDDGKTASAVLPEFNKIRLSEGSYEIRVYVYGNTSLALPATTKTECVDVPKGGLLGLFGQTKEKCFDITIPATKIDSALIGGGKSKNYLLDSDLSRGGIILNAQSLPKPNSVEQLAQNFELFETRRINLEFYEKK